MRTSQTKVLHYAEPVELWIITFGVVVASCLAIAI